MLQMSHPVEDRTHDSSGSPTITVKVEGPSPSRAEHEEDLNVSDFLVELNKLCSESMRAYDAHSTALNHFKSATMRDISSTCRCIENNGICAAEVHDQSLTDDLGKHMSSYRCHLAETIVKLCSLLGPSRLQHLVKWCERHTPHTGAIPLGPDGNLLPQHVHEQVKTMVERDAIATNTQQFNLARANITLPSLPMSLPNLPNVGLQFPSSSMAQMMSFTSPSATSLALSSLNSTMMNTARLRSIATTRQPITLAASEVPLPPNVSVESIDIKSLSSNDIVGLWRNMAPRDLMKQYSHRAKKLVNAHIRRVAYLRHQRCPSLFQAYFKHKPHVDAAERDLTNLDMRPEGLFMALDKLSDHDLQRLWLHCREDRRDRPHPLMALATLGHDVHGSSMRDSMGSSGGGSSSGSSVEVNVGMGSSVSGMGSNVGNNVNHETNVGHNVPAMSNLPSTMPSAIPAIGDTNVATIPSLSHLSHPNESSAATAAMTSSSTIPSVSSTLPSVPATLPSLASALPSVSGALPSVVGSLPTVAGALAPVNLSLPNNISLPSGQLSLPNSQLSLTSGQLSLPSTIPLTIVKDSPETPAAKRRRTVPSVYASNIPSSTDAATDTSTGATIDSSMPVTLPLSSATLSSDDLDDSLLKSPDARHTPCPSRISDSLLQEPNDPVVLVRGVLGKIMRNAGCEKGDYPSVTHCLRCHLRLVLLQRHNADPAGGLSFLFPAPEKVPLSRPPFPELISYLREMDTWYLLRLYHIAVPAARNVAEYVRLRIAHSGNDGRASRAREMGPLEVLANNTSALEHLFHHGIPALPAPVPVRSVAPTTSTNLPTSLTSSIPASIATISNALNASGVASMGSAGMGSSGMGSTATGTATGMNGVMSSATDSNDSHANAMSHAHPHPNHLLTLGVNLPAINTLNLPSLVNLSLPNVASLQSVAHETSVMLPTYTRIFLHCRIQSAPCRQ